MNRSIRSIRGILVASTALVAMVAGSGALVAAANGTVYPACLASPCPSGTLQLTAVTPLNPTVSLQGQGGALLLSDDPEYITAADALPGALYRDTVQGAFRVFYHHDNQTGAPLTVAIAVTNPGTQPVLVYARGHGEGLSPYPDVAGQEAVVGFLQTRSQVDFLGSLAAGQSLFFAAQAIPPGQVASALVDLVAIAPPAAAAHPGALPPPLPAAAAAALMTHPFAGPPRGTGFPLLPAGFSPASVTATTVAYTGTPPTAPASLPVLPQSPAGVAHMQKGLLSRGTFPHYDRFGTFTLAVSAGNASLAVDTAPPGYAYSSAMSGEYEVGRDAVDGGVTGYDSGNYGVLYNFQATLQNNEEPAKVPYGLLMRPTGGFGHYAMEVDGQIEVSPFLSYRSYWLFDETVLLGNRQEAGIDSTLPGGSYGPQMVYFVPGFTPPS